jgi:predicted metal-dependent phosphoesterase TrpH
MSNKLNVKIDLHTHTHHSPCSKQTIKEMLDSAKLFGLEVVAITDHDSVAGIDEALAYGKQIGIKVIPGIEITATSGNDVPSLIPHTRIDILGYCINWHSQILHEFYADLLKKKKIWTQNVLEVLWKQGFKLEYEQLKGYSELFIIRQLIEKGYCKDRSDAKKLIRTKEILGQYPFVRPDLKESIDLIHTIGGISVLAHAYRGLGRNALDDQQVLDMILKMKEYGLMGVETHHYFHVEENKYDKLLKICREHHLIPTIGSDHHSTTEIYNGITDDDKRKSVFATVNHDFHEILDAIFHHSLNQNH